MAMMAMVTPVDAAGRYAPPRFQIVEKSCLKSGIFRYFALIV